MIPFAQRYLSKLPFFTRTISSAPSADLFLTIVIPAHNEPDLLLCLESLSKCQKTNSQVEVIVVINESEGTSEEVKMQNLQSLQELHDWKLAHQQAPFTLHTMHPAPFRHKFRGVGSARKAGMDEAIARYNIINKPHGVIVSLDADTFVETNYLIEIERFFKSHENIIGCTIDFQHRTNELSNPKQQEGMRIYEKYLHYFKEALAYSGYPHAMHTIGSAFAFRADAYVKQGGMPRRQAGEDFYFLHKLTNMGNIAELHSTCVYPSARISNRVPFGTGPSIQKWIDGDRSIGMSYSLDAFCDLKTFFASLPMLHTSKQTVELPLHLANFLEEEAFWTSILPELQQNSSNYKNFEKRFFQYFNAFKIIKFLNSTHPHSYPLGEVDELHENLMKLLKIEVLQSS